MYYKLSMMIIALTSVIGFPTALNVFCCAVLMVFYSDTGNLTEYRFHSRKKMFHWLINKKERERLLQQF